MVLRSVEPAICAATSASGRRVVEEEDRRVVEPVLGQQSLSEVTSLDVRFTGENPQRQHLRILSRGLPCKTPN